MAKKKKQTTIKPFAELSEMYKRYEAFIENAFIFAVQGVLFLLSLAAILFVLFATGLLVF